MKQFLDKEPIQANPHSLFLCKENYCVKGDR